jgi:hypothetical protein
MQAGSTEYTVWHVRSSSYICMFSVGFPTQFVSLLLKCIVIILVRNYVTQVCFMKRKQYALSCRI